MVPGNRSYSSATKYGKKTIVIEDSTCVLLIGNYLMNLYPIAKGTLNILVVPNQ